MHRFTRLSYKVVPSTSTSTAGRVTLAPVYAGGAAPQTITDLNNLVGARSSAVWDEVSIQLDVSAMYPFGKYKKVVKSAVKDVSNSDAAHVFLAFDGVASAVSVSLWVDYEVELFMPRTSITQDLLNAHSIAVTPNSTNLSTSFTKVPMTLVSDFNPFNLVQAGDGLILPAGIWEVELCIEHFTASAQASGNYWSRPTLGDDSSEFTAPYQLPGLKSHTYMQLSHTTGSGNVHGNFDKLLYLSDGTTPLCLWFDSQLASNLSVTGHSRVLLSPLG